MNNYFCQSRHTRQTPIPLSTTAMMYPFADYKTEAPLSWAESYPTIGVGAAAVGSESLQSHFNNGTPDSTDSYAYPQQNNGYYQSQYPAEPHTVPNYYPAQHQQHQQQHLQQQHQQQQQQSYYNTDSYYPSNGAVGPYADQRQSPEYYQQNVSQMQQQQQPQQQQQFGFNSYQGINGSGQWHQSVNSSFVGHLSQQQQQQQHQQQQHLEQQHHAFIKSEPTSFNSVRKREVLDHAAAAAQHQQHQQQSAACMDNGSTSNASGCSSSSSSGGNNFFFENFQEMQSCETSPGFNVSPTSTSTTQQRPGRLPSMPQFGFTQEMSFKMEPQQKSNFSFQTEPKPAKADRITDHLKEKKKSRAAAKRLANRFNGMSEEEVAKRGLPDYLREGLDIVFIGINPSMFAAYTGKYYDGPGNHFWQALHLSRLLPELMSAEDDHKLLDLGIGFTNIVARTTRGLSDLSRAEIAEGAKILREKLLKFRPKIAVFNGKAIYEVYSGQKKFMFGRQPEPIVDMITGEKTWLWVMPSSSARCAQLPRAVDKVPFFDALRKFRDHLSGKMPHLDTCEIVFANVTLKNPAKKIKTDPGAIFFPPLPQQPLLFLPPAPRQINDRFVDYTRLEPVTDGRPANVPPSVGSVIESVIQKFSTTSDEDFDDDDDDDLDFRDEDSNGIGEMNFKQEDFS